MFKSVTMGVSIIASMNAASNIKRAGVNPARHYKFNRFYPANKTHCKYTTFFIYRKFFEQFFNLCFVLAHVFAIFAATNLNHHGTKSFEQIRLAG